MILTGSAIDRACRCGDIEIAPFAAEHLNPNSYNFTLGKTLVEVESANPYHLGKPIRLKSSGFVVEPGHLYLGSTAEQIGSKRYVTTLLGRSSIGRLGLFLNVSADLGHAGCDSEWTLELTVVQPLRLYPGMAIGQVAFWEQTGEPLPYGGRYHRDRGPRGNADATLSGLSA
jgi:dCTP deaminase